MFRGGPQPINPLARPLRNEDAFNLRFKPVPPEDDEDWLELIRCGGAGKVADTKEEQIARYATEAEKSPEANPDLTELMLSKPDVIVTCSMDYLIKTWDVNDSYRPLQVFEGHLNFVNVVVPCRGDNLLSCSDDYTCRLWKLGDAGSPGELLMTYWIHGFPIKSVCELPGQRAACGGQDKIVRIFSLVTGHTLHRITDHGVCGPEDSYFQKQGCGAVWSVLHLRGNIIVSGSEDATVRVWDIDTGKALGSAQIGHLGWGEEIGATGLGWKLSERFGAVWKLCHLGKDGNQFASCSYDRTICIWDASDLENVRVIRSWKAAENGVLNVSLVGKCHIASCGSDKEVKIWNFETGELVHKIQTRGIASAVAMIDEHVIAIAGGDATLRIYDWSKGKDLTGKHGFYAHDMTLRSVAKLRHSDQAQSNWTTCPIMYQSCKWPECEADSIVALEQMRRVMKNSLDFQF
ncbi:unnamed protein product [Polarella glacialis]|uniref:Guanine nucleotide-binding protein subunit beta-like protein n=1 Tax=Polarella glacialis TaxID=89957 RepID=A0A813LR58_POLGL|nr:unnamed protein product [Polarella glacialis]